MYNYFAGHFSVFFFSFQYSGLSNSDVISIASVFSALLGTILLIVVTVLLAYLGYRCKKGKGK